MADTAPAPLAEMPPVKVAFIIDNQVVDVIHTVDRLAAILLSDPIIVDVTGTDGKPTVVVGAKYDPSTGEFTNPI